MLRRSAVISSILAVLTALVLLTVPGLPASAHSALVSSTPEDGASLTTMPATVSLEFNENIQQQGTQVIVADHADVAHPVTPQVHGPTVNASIPEGLPPGLVHVRYRVVSADGHPITGEISFTVEGGPTSAPTTGGNVAPAVPAPTANPTPADGDGSTTMMYVLSGVAAVIIVVGGIVVFLSGRRRR